MASSWWLQLGKKTSFSELAPLSQPNILPETQSSKPRTLTLSGSMWPWSYSEEVVSAETPTNNKDATSERLKAYGNSWWSRMLGSSMVESQNHPADTKSTQVIAGITEPESQGWFLWMFSPPQNITDLETEVEDQSTAQLFREAKLAIESCRDTCHYAISGHYGSTDLELAVTGTGSESRPVRYNHMKKPTIANEHFETSMVVNRLMRANSPPLAIADQKKDFSSRNGKVSSTHKVLSFTRELPLALSLGKEDAVSCNSSIKGIYVNASPQNSSIVLPDLNENFRVITLTTKLRLFGEAMIYGDGTLEKHLYTSTRRSIQSKKKKVAKKAVVISVHSFLPTKFVKLIIGQSTGSALKIANSALRAIQLWLDQTCELGDIQYISLEGIGTINSRAKGSFELLQNWAADIKGADFVYFVSNSVASPVVYLLAQKMFESEIFDISTKKIGLLSIAGANLGPYLGVDSKVVIRAYNQTENEIIKELFELQKPTSALSLSTKNAIQCLCINNVKITMAGSVSDQFIPLCSSLAQHIRHPNIYRCIFVDEASDVPLFIVKLISTILTMENVGYGDHNLLWLLQETTQGGGPLSGSHGKIYSDDTIYEVGVRFALETTTVRHNRDTKEAVVNVALNDAERNMYHLPWCVRGLLNDLVQIKHIRNMTLLDALQKQYVSWEPSTRHWRTVKQCFAAFEDLDTDDILL